MYRESTSAPRWPIPFQPTHQINQPKPDEESSPQKTILSTSLSEFQGGTSTPKENVSPHKAPSDVESPGSMVHSLSNLSGQTAKGMVKIFMQNIHPGELRKN